MLYIAFAGRPVLDSAGVAGRLFEQLERLVEREARSRSHVAHFARDLSGRGVARKKVGADGIFDVSKISALFAVAKNRRFLSAKHRRDELGQDSRIRRSRILIGPEDVEVAQADGFETVTAVEAAHVVLAGK